MGRGVELLRPLGRNGWGLVKTGAWRWTGWWIVAWFVHAFVARAPTVAVVLGVVWCGCSSSSWNCVRWALQEQAAWIREQFRGGGALYDCHSPCSAFAFLLGRAALDAVVIYKYDAPCTACNARTKLAKKTRGIGTAKVQRKDAQDQSANGEWRNAMPSLHSPQPGAATTSQKTTQADIYRTATTHASSACEIRQ